MDENQDTQTPKQDPQQANPGPDQQPAAAGQAGSHSPDASAQSTQPSQAAQAGQTEPANQPAQTGASEQSTQPNQSAEGGQSAQTGQADQQGQTNQTSQTDAGAKTDQPGQSQGEKAKDSGSGKPKILLAEDEEDARIIYMDILGDQEFEVDSAPNGKETLQKLESKVYDLLLLDIIMPDMDGISVLTEVKNYPAKYGTPKVVMLTNIGGDLAIEKALDIGANGYMLKSETEPDELVNVIKKYLAGQNNVKLEKTLLDT
jgi:CheY-like chemotaxis protein